MSMPKEQVLTGAPQSLAKISDIANVSGDSPLHDIASTSNITPEQNEIFTRQAAELSRTINRPNIEARARFFEFRQKHTNVTQPIWDRLLQQTITVIYLHGEVQHYQQYRQSEQNQKAFIFFKIQEVRAINDLRKLLELPTKDSYSREELIHESAVIGQLELYIQQARRDPKVSHVISEQKNAKESAELYRKSVIITARDAAQQAYKAADSEDKNKGSHLIEKIWLEKVMKDPAWTLERIVEYYDEKLRHKNSTQRNADLKERRAYFGRHIGRSVPVLGEADLLEVELPEDTPIALDEEGSRAVVRAFDSGATLSIPVKAEEFLATRDSVGVQGYKGDVFTYPAAVLGGGTQEDAQDIERHQAALQEHEIEAQRVQFLIWYKKTVEKIQIEAAKEKDIEAVERRASSYRERKEDLGAVLSDTWAYSPGEIALDVIAEDFIGEYFRALIASGQDEDNFRDIVRGYLEASFRAEIFKKRHVELLETLPFGHEDAPQIPSEEVQGDLLTRYYERLGLLPGATRDEIVNAYKLGLREIRRLSKNPGDEDRMGMRLTSARDALLAGLEKPSSAQRLRVATRRIPVSVDTSESPTQSGQTPEDVRRIKESSAASKIKSADELPEEILGIQFDDIRREIEAIDILGDANIIRTKRKDIEKQINDAAVEALKALNYENGEDNDQIIKIQAAQQKLLLHVDRLLKEKERAADLQEALGGAGNTKEIDPAIAKSVEDERRAKFKKKIEIMKASFPERAFNRTASLAHGVALFLGLAGAGAALNELAEYEVDHSKEVAAHDDGAVLPAPTHESAGIHVAEGVDKDRDLDRDMNTPGPMPAAALETTTTYESPLTDTYVVKPGDEVRKIVMGLIKEEGLTPTHEKVNTLSHIAMEVNGIPGDGSSLAIGTVLNMHNVHEVLDEMAGKPKAAGMVDEDATSSMPVSPEYAWNNPASSMESSFGQASDPSAYGQYAGKMYSPYFAHETVSSAKSEKAYSSIPTFEHPEHALKKGEYPFKIIHHMLLESGGNWSSKLMGELVAETLEENGISEEDARRLPVGKVLTFKRAAWYLAERSKDRGAGKKMRTILVLKEQMRAAGEL